MSSQNLTRSLATATCAVLIVGLNAVSAQVQNPVPQPDTHLVASAELAKFLPAPDGWTRGPVRTNQVEISQACTYTYANATYTKDDVRIKVTIADTAAHQEGLMTLVAAVVTLPDGHTATLPPATSITRVRIMEMPAAEMWDAQKSEGEITMVVSGRFAIVLEAAKADSLETVRGILRAIDVKALAALK
jgi:hypothetical protein